MPKIMQDNEQVKALNTVTSDLTAIETLNKLIALSDDEANFSVATKVEGERGMCSAAISPRLTAKVRQILISQRAILVKEILALTAKYRIELSDDEKTAIEDA